MSRKGRLLLKIASTVFFLLVIINFTRALGEQEHAVPENPITGRNQASSQILWSGQGYDTDEGKQTELMTARILETELETELMTETELETELITELQTEIYTEIGTELVTEYVTEIETEWIEVPNEGQNGAAETAPDDGAQKPNKIEYKEDGNGGLQDGQSSADDNENQAGAQTPEASQTPSDTQPETPDPEAEKYPVIASDLTDGETVAGSYRTFYVRAVDYKEKYLAAGSLTVYGNGQKLYSTSDSGEVVAYRLDLTEGANTIQIAAADSEGRTASVSYTIYRGEDAQIPAGTITFSLEASTVGLGYLIGPSSEVFYEGEQLSYVIDRVLQQYGYTYRYDGSLTNGFYLKHVIRSGITSGYAIPADLEAKLIEMNCPQEAHHLDSLGEFDFTKNSGWMYQVNGVHMSTGISTYYPADGDVVRIRFSLYGGSDIGGGMTGETWGDW